MDKKQLLTIITCTVVVGTALCIHDLVKMALTEKPKQSISEEISAEAEPTAKPEAESTEIMEEAEKDPEEILVKKDGYWFYLIEFIEGRPMQDTPEDELVLGKLVRILHSLKDILGAICLESS